MPHMRFWNVVTDRFEPAVAACGASIGPAGGEGGGVTDAAHVTCATCRKRLDSPRLGARPHNVIQDDGESLQAALRRQDAAIDRLRATIQPAAADAVRRALGV